MRIYGRLLIALITLASMNVWGGHIQGAHWFPRGKLGYYIQDLIKDPDSRIVLYCRTGGRPTLATLTLQDMDYTNVVDLDGGFKELVDPIQALRVPKGCSTTARRVRII
jgi:rhodanese-related sulfurtransferase